MHRETLLPRRTDVKQKPALEILNLGANPVATHQVLCVILG